MVAVVVAVKFVVERVLLAERPEARVAAVAVVAVAVSRRLTRPVGPLVAALRPHDHAVLVVAVGLIGPEVLDR